MHNFEQEFKQLRIHSHVDQLYHWKHGEAFAPVNVELSPVSYCNQRCKYCYAAGLEYPRDKMDTRLLLSAVQQFAAAGVKTLRIQGTGEPTLHPALGDAVCAAAQSGLYVSLTTNGILLRPKLSDTILPHVFMLKLSVLDSSPERYARFHGVSTNHWKTLVRNIEYMSAYKQRNAVHNFAYATIYIESDNHMEIPYICAFCKELGLEYVVVSVATYNDSTPESSNDNLRFLESKPDYFEWLRTELHALETASFKVQYNFADRRCHEKYDTTCKADCPGIDFYTMVNATGSVYPCYRFWGNEGFSFGNLAQNTFGNIWNGKRRLEVKEAIAQTCYSHLCSVCAHSRINVYLKELRSPSLWTNYF